MPRGQKDGMTKIPSLPAILGRDGCSESSTNRPIFCSEKIRNDMPLFAHGDAARCHGSAPCKSPDLRSEGEEKSLLAYTSSLLTEQVPQWWTLVPAGDGHVTCFGVSLRSQCRSRRVCPHFFFTAACPRRGAVGQRLHRINRPYILIHGIL